MTAGKEFERVAYNIFLALRQNSDEVLQNKMIVDPDTGRLRQVDILVRTKDGQKIHVECRDHSAKQDVKWIEELYGRKLSLGANLIIGVSSSGFTEPAKKKAKALGVLVKEIKDSTARDIAIIAKIPCAEIGVFQVKDISVKFFYQREPDGAEFLRTNFDAGGVCEAIRNYFDSQFPFFEMKSGDRMDNEIRHFNNLMFMGQKIVRREIDVIYSFEKYKIAPFLMKTMKDAGSYTDYEANYFQHFFREASFNIVTSDKAIQYSVDLSKVSRSFDFFFCHQLSLGPVWFDGQIVNHRITPSSSPIQYGPMRVQSCYETSP